MDLKVMGFDPAVVDTLHELLDFTDESDKSSHHAPSHAYVCDAKAMAATLADVKEYPDAYVFVIDMPRLKSNQIKVHMEDDNMLVVGTVSGMMNYVTLLGICKSVKREINQRSLLGVPADPTPMLKSVFWIRNLRNWNS